MYGIIVWWTAVLVKKNSRKLDKVIRSACLGITGSMRTTPTDALFALLGIPKSADFSKSVAASAAIRLSSTGQWVAKPYGHSNILDSYNIKLAMR